MGQEITVCDCGNPEGHVGSVWHPGQPIPSFVKLTEAELLEKLRIAKKNASAFVAKSAEISAVVIRCGCGDPDSHNGKNGPARPCPHPRTVSDIGVVDRADRSLFKRLQWRFVGKPAANKKIAAANRI